MKTFARVAVAGVAGFTLLKLFTTVLIPILGLMMGLVALAVKVAVVATVAYFIWSLLSPKRDRDGEPDASELDEKVEIVVEETPEEKGD